MLEAQAKTLITSGMDIEIMQRDSADAVINGMSKRVADADYKELEDDLTEKYYSTGSGAGQDDENRKQLLKEYNITATGDEKKDVEMLYKAMAGVTEIPEELKDNTENIAKEIGKMAAVKQAQDSTTELINRVDKIANKDTRQKTAAIISGEAAGTSINQLDELQDISSEQLAASLGYSNADDLAAAMLYQDKKLSELSAEEQKRYAATQIKDGESVEDWIKKNANTTVSASAQLELELEMNLEQLEAEKNKAISLIKANTGLDQPQILNLVGEYDLNTVKALSDQTSSMGQEAAVRYLEAFNSAVQDNQKLTNYLSSLDLSSMDQLMEALDYMRGEGADSQAIESFWEAAISGANTYISSLNEVLGLVSKFQGSFKSIAEIADRLAEGKGTYNDMVELIKAGVDVKDFQLTTEGWKATEGQTKEAVDQLKKAKADDARKMAEQQRKTYDQAVAMMHGGQIWRDPDDGTFNIGANTALSNVTGTSDDGTRLVAGTLTNENAANVAAAIGMSAEEYRRDVANESVDEWIARIQGRYEEFIDLINNGEEITLVAEKNAAMAEASLFNAAEAEALGHGDESVIYSAQHEATEAGIDIGELTEYASALQSINTELSEVDATQIALANSKLNMGLGEIIGSYDEWTGLIDENTGIIKASSSEDVAAYNKLKKSVNKMLNTSEDLSKAFWDNKKNMDNLKKAAEGDAEALEALQKAAGMDYINQLDLSSMTSAVGEAQTAIDNFTTYLSDINIPTLEAGVQWDDSGATDFINRFNDMASAANMTAEQIQESVRAMGFDAKISYVEDTRSVPTEYTERVIDDYDPSSGMPTKWHTVTSNGAPQEVTGYFPVIETLTASGSGGGGISVNNTEAGQKNSGSGGGSKPKTQH